MHGQQNTEHVNQCDITTIYNNQPILSISHTPWRH